jgi:hypothetical protein
MLTAIEYRYGLTLENVEQLILKTWFLHILLPSRYVILPASLIFILIHGRLSLGIAVLTLTLNRFTNEQPERNATFYNLFKSSKHPHKPADDPLPAAIQQRRLTPFSRVNAIVERSRYAAVVLATT